MSKLNEHLWSGIIHRSETGEERKEYNVDLLDCEELFEYVKRKYKGCGPEPDNIGWYLVNDMKVCVGFSPKREEYTQSIHFNKKDGHCNLKGLGTKHLETFLLEDKHYVGVKDARNNVFIFTRTNTDFLKLLDDYIEWCEKYPKYSYARDHIRKKIER